jgi:peptidoglycan/LPS O-acetylase OafA/YrhL
MNVTKAIALRSSLGHWSMMLLCATLLVIIATIAHVFVERPGIELGNRFKTMFRKYQTATAAE